MCFLFISKSFFTCVSLVISFKFNIVSLTLKELSTVFILQYLLYFSFFMYTILFIAILYFIPLSLNSKKLFLESIFIANFIDSFIFKSKLISFDIYVNTDNLSEMMFSFKL